MREGLKNVIRFWKEKGVKGFRFDVLNLISKPEHLEECGPGSAHSYCKDGWHIHDFIREMVTDTGIESMVTVGEMASTTLDNCIRYTKAGNHELSMCFSFHHLKVDYKNGDKWALQEPDLIKLRNLFREWQEEMERNGGWNAVFWCNHDQPRVVSRFGDEGTYWKQSAKMLGLFVHGLRGTPYIFQGEEIGMTNAGFTDISQYQDVESLSYYQILLKRGVSKEDALRVLSQLSRDNGRTPMQWNGGKNAGFTDGTPWIGLPANYETINVEREEQDPDSILHFYRKLVRLRKEQPVIAEGTIQFLDSGNDKVMAYQRRLEDRIMTVICSFSGETETNVAPELLREAREGQILIGSYQDAPEWDRGLRPFEALLIMR